MRTLLACTAITAVAALGATGCPNISVDPGEGSGEITVGPTVEFDPANSIIPFPNNLLISPTTGKVTIPAACNESATQTALREGVLNTLDGFGTFEVAIQATFTAGVGSASLNGSDVVLYERASNGSALDPATATPVPTFVHSLGAFPRYEADCTTVDMVETMTLVPLVPLDQKSTYTVAMLDGIQDANGSAFQPSFTWSLVRQAVDPVTLAADGSIASEQTPLDPSQGSAVVAELQGIDLLWKAHASALAFLDQVPAVGSDRSKILLAWDFNTATVTDPIDAHIATSVAGKVSTDPLFDAGTQLGGATPLQFLHATAVGPLCTTDATGSAVQPGGYIPCNAVGDIQGGLLTEDLYQTDTPNAFAPNSPIPGPWNDPYNPTVVHANAQIKTIIMIPAGTMPAAGWPTIIYGHGLGSRKETLVAIGPQLASLGFASVGIDWVNHGDRAVQITADAALGCDGANLDPSASPQCFVPFLGADLATDRDNVRQSVVDVHRLHAALKACGATPTPAACGGLAVDADHIGYIGISLGGILGSTFASTADLPGATLNVSGVGLVDILENTPNLEIACSLVDALIDAGVLTGDKSNLAASPPTGLCTTHAWLQQPGYQTFAGAARWILDPADGANFTPKLAHQKMFLQEVVNDQVVPNIATDDEGALVGLTPGSADAETTGQNPPSMALTASVTTNHWIRYTDLQPDASTSFPGNGFQHASLLSPDTSISITAGVLGTIRVETDALTFLAANVLPH